MRETFVESWLEEVYKKETGDDEFYIDEIAPDVVDIIERALDPDISRSRKKVIAETLLGGKTELVIPIEEVLREMDEVKLTDSILKSRTTYDDVLTLERNKFGVLAGASAEQRGAYALNKPLSDTQENRELLWNQSYQLFSSDVDWYESLDYENISAYEGRFVGDKFEISETAVRNMAMIDASNSLAVYLERRKANLKYRLKDNSIAITPAGYSPHSNFVKLHERGLQNSPLNSQGAMFLFYYNSFTLDSKGSGLNLLFRRDNMGNSIYIDPTWYETGLGYAENLISKMDRFSSDEFNNEERDYIRNSLQTKAIGVKDHSVENFLTGGFVARGQRLDSYVFEREFSETALEKEEKIAKEVNGQYSSIVHLNESVTGGRISPTLINFMHYSPELFGVVEYSNPKEATEWYVDTFIRQYKGYVAKFLFQSISDVVRGLFLDKDDMMTIIQDALQEMKEPLERFLASEVANIEELGQEVYNIFQIYEDILVKSAHTESEVPWKRARNMFSFYHSRLDESMGGAFPFTLKSRGNLTVKTFSPIYQALVEAKESFKTIENFSYVGSNFTSHNFSPEGASWSKSFLPSTTMSYEPKYSGLPYSSGYTELGIRPLGLDISPTLLEDVFIHEGKWKQVFSQPSFSQQLERMNEVIRANIKSGKVGITTKRFKSDVVSYDLDGRFIGEDILAERMTVLQGLYKDSTVEILKTLSEYILEAVTIEEPLVTRGSSVIPFITRKSTWQDFLSNVSDRLNKESLAGLSKAGDFYVSIDPYEIMTSSMNDSNWSSCHVSSYGNSPISLASNEVTFIVYQRNANRPTITIGDKEVDNKVRRVYGHLLVEGDEIAIALEHFYPSFGLGTGIQEFLLEKLARVANKESSELIETDLPFLIGSPDVNNFLDYSNYFDENGVFYEAGYFDYFLASGTKTLASKTLVERAKEELLKFILMSAGSSDASEFGDIYSNDAEFLIDLSNPFFIPEKISADLVTRTRYFLERVFFYDKDNFEQDLSIAPISIPDFLTGEYYEDYIYDRDYYNGEEDMYYGAFFSSF